MSNKATILIAEDDRSIRVVLEQALSRAGHMVRATESGKILWDWIEAGEGDLVITDVLMPDVNGLDLIPRIKNKRPNLKVIVMSAQNTLLTAIKAAERGAFEYLPKPFDLDELTSIVDRAIKEPNQKVIDPQNFNFPSEEKLPLIGRSPAMQDIYRTVARLTTSDLTVMITGESGTGKELVARALHDYGKRKDGAFIALNMAAIPRELIESELFGHEKGAFTGAVTAGMGRFKQAQRGTLFLDEIGDMPLDAQTRLLRVLQEGEFTTVGGRSAIKGNVRIIASTHRDLSHQVNLGHFREDLFYRLNVVPMRLPPLRERIEDIPDLAQHFLRNLTTEGLPQKSIEKKALERMQHYKWPGNVRELENLVRRIAVLYSQQVITQDLIEVELAETAASGAKDEGESASENLSEAVERHLNEYFNAHEGGLPPTGLYDRVLHEVERPLINISLSSVRGNQVKAAELLGLNRNTLRKKIRDLGIAIVKQPR